jgi:hypothetical protein
MNVIRVSVYQSNYTLAQSHITRANGALLRLHAGPFCFHRSAGVDATNAHGRGWELGECCWWWHSFEQGPADFHEHNAIAVASRQWTGRPRCRQVSASGRIVSKSMFIRFFFFN